MHVPVKVLKGFEGATDKRGIHTAVFEEGQGGGDEPLYLDAEMAAGYEADGLVDILPFDGDDDADGDSASAPAPTNGQTGAPDGAVEYDDLLRWIGKATAKPLSAWLVELEQEIPSGSNIATLRSIAVAVAERENDERGN